MRVPVTVITGYLGAGKTTLLRRIVDESGNGGMRLAIIMNEFGDIAIDSRVVEGRNVAMAELAGGCVCCSLSGEFTLAVAELIEKAKPDWIVVETTGAAEPAALAYDIQENIPLVRLDSVVTVVDADAMARFPGLGDTGRQQIELADMIIINKTDLVDNAALAGVIAALDALNGRAAKVKARMCGIDTSALFGIGREAAAPPHPAHSISLGCFDFATDALFDHESLARVLGSLPEGIYRAKGFARTERGGFLVNYVAGRLGMEDAACERSELVFIGEGAEARKDEVTGALRGAQRRDAVSGE